MHWKIIKLFQERILPFQAFDINKTQRKEQGEEMILNCGLAYIAVES